RIELDVFDENDLAGFGLEDRIVDYSIQALPVTGGQKFECTRCAARRSNQAFALRIFANSFEQAEKRLLHARDPSGAAALNLADSTFSRLQLSFGFGISVTHWINLAGLGAVSRSGGLQSAEGDLEIARP